MISGLVLVALVVGVLALNVWVDRREARKWANYSDAVNSAILWEAQTRANDLAYIHGVIDRATWLAAAKEIDAAATEGLPIGGYKIISEAQ